MWWIKIFTNNHIQMEDNKKCEVGHLKKFHLKHFLVEVQSKEKISAIYLWRKVVCLFCFVLFVLMRSTEPGCFRSCSWSLWKALERRSGLVWFHGIWTYGAKVLEYGMIFSLKIKFNFSWKFWRKWNMALCCWKDLDEQDLMKFIW